MCQTGSIGVLVYVQHFNQILVLLIQQEKVINYLVEMGFPLCR